MYKLFLRGLDDVEVPDEIGRVIAEQYNSNTLPERLVINDGLSFEGKAVKGIKHFSQLSSEQTKEENNAKIERINTDFDTHMRAVANKPAEERAKDLRFAKMVWFAHTGTNEMDAAVRAEIEAEQLKDLQANPKAIFANPMCLKAIVKRHGTNPPTGKDFKTMAQAMRSQAMSTALNCYGATLAYEAVDSGSSS